MMYAIIDLANLGPHSLPLANAAYGLWLRRFAPILAAAGERLHPDLFFRARFLSLLSEGGEPVALALHQVYDLRLAGAIQLSYFDPLRPDVRARLAAGGERILSIEWAAVSRAASRRSCYEVLIGLCGALLMDSGLTSTMGFSRMDVGADRMVAQFGAERIDIVERHGIACGAMHCTRHAVRPHPDAGLQARIDHLYLERRDYAQLTRKLHPLDEESGHEAIPRHAEGGGGRVGGL